MRQLEGDVVQGVGRRPSLHRAPLLALHPPPRMQKCSSEMKRVVGECRRDMGECTDAIVMSV